ncbi:ATP-binding protein, partial [bacterium]|nr:ATP-binding protein [bacterium]
MIHVLDNGLEISNGNLQFAWFKLSTQSGDFFRCVALHELTSIPFDVNNETDTLGLQWAALKGIYDARVDYIYTAMGIFHPDHIGVVQLYGSAATAETMDAAAERAVSGLTAVRAALANFRQSQTNSPRLEWLRWYLDFVNRARPLALLGYPDPRSQKRGLGREGDLPDYGSDDLATEQNEILFRGLAKIRQDFVFQVTANHVRRGDLARAFMDIARLTSNFASRQRGVKSIGFSLGVPIMAALGQGV